jgi:sugar phosphate isomerase/epimerase
MARITSCATLGYADYGLSTALECIAAMRFERVEITELGSYCRHFPHGQTTAATVAAELKAAGLRAVAMNVSASRMEDGEIYRPRLGDPACTEEIVAYAGWFLRQAKELGAGVVSFPIGPRMLEERHWCSEMKASVDGYLRIADMAAACGVGLNIEAPHLYQLVDSVPHVREVLDALGNTTVGVTVDSSHWGILKYDLEAYLSWLGPRLTHVHLRDSAGADTRNFHQNLELTPGRGTVDFAAFAQALDQAGYRGDVSVEFEYRGLPLERIRQEYIAGLSHLQRCGWLLGDGVKDWLKHASQ